MVELRRATHGDVVSLSRRLRSWDVRECAAMGHTPKQALHLGRIGSVLCRTAVIDGRAEAILGLVVESLVDGVGRPWMLRSDRPAGRALMRRSAALVGEMQAITPHLANWVHAENASTIRWLRRLGFDIGRERTEMGGEPMLRFWKSPCAILSP